MLPDYPPLVFSLRPNEVLIIHVANYSDDATEISEPHVVGSW